jgi:hypothetical protein
MFRKDGKGSDGDNDDKGPKQRSDALFGPEVLFSSFINTNSWFSFYLGFIIYVSKGRGGFGWPAMTTKGLSDAQMRRLDLRDTMQLKTSQRKYLFFFIIFFCHTNIQELQQHVRCSL